jgi:hypothetical protein
MKHGHLQGKTKAPSKPRTHNILEVFREKNMKG